MVTLNLLRRNRPGITLLVIGLLLMTMAGSALAQGDSKTHTVQEGETLTSIAAIYNLTVSDLMAANDLTDPDNIAVGTVLVIPATAPAEGEAAPAGETATPAEAIPVPAPPSDGTVHVVQPLDVLDSIAQTYNISVESIAYANDLEAPYVILPGQVLIIPADGTPYGIVPAAPGQSASGLLDGQGGGGAPVGQIYVVQPRDGLDSIGQTYDISVESIAYANDLVAPYPIFPGQVLVIPADGSPYGVVPPNPDLLPSGLSDGQGGGGGFGTGGSTGLLDGQGGGTVSTTSGQVYVVREGDSVLSIVFAYNLDLADFLRANAFLLNNIPLDTGTELVLP